METYAEGGERSQRASRHRGGQRNTQASKGASRQQDGSAGGDEGRRLCEHAGGRRRGPLAVHADQSCAASGGAAEEVKPPPRAVEPRRSSGGEEPRAADAAMSTSSGPTAIPLVPRRPSPPGCEVHDDDNVGLSRGEERSVEFGQPRCELLHRTHDQFGTGIHSAVGRCSGITRTCTEPPVEAPRRPRRCRTDPSP